jgi:quercetin dioxygenase-like cupin family protein
MQKPRSSIATGTGSAEWFTGQVYVDTVTSPTAPSRLQPRASTSRPARTAWHTHPLLHVVHVAAVVRRMRTSRRTVRVAPT